MQEPRRAQLQPLVLANTDTWAPPERVLESHPEPGHRDGRDVEWDKGVERDTDMGEKRRGDGQRNGMEMAKEWDEDAQSNVMEMAKGMGWRWTKEWDGCGQRRWERHGCGQRNGTEMLKGMRWRLPKE